MSWRTQESDDRIIVHFVAGRGAATLELVDGPLCTSMAEVCQDARAKDKFLVFDMQRIAFMSSSTVGELVFFHKAAKDAGVAVRLANLCPNVREILRITKLTKVFRCDLDEGG